MAENHDPIIADGEGPEVAEETAGASAEGGCPVVHGRVHPTQGDANSQWWPNRLNLRILAKNPVATDPYHGEFDYAAAFKTLDLAAVKADIAAVLTDSKPWWPADFGSYAGLFVRMAWHAAGTYRVSDGRGGAGSGQQRFAPLNSWPDNVSLDKARRLLWPVKKKYGKKLSWADLIVLAGNVAMEAGGFKTFGFGGGRVDVYEPDADVYWGPETEWLGDERYSGDRELADPFGAVQMGLIYVNPEGPNGNPDIIAAGRDIRETFGRMAMNDEETVALIAGGHTFGKTHGAGPAESVGADPEAAPIEQQGFGWKSSYGTGVGADAITSGLEVTWTYHPTRWDNEFFHILFGYEWELFQSPAGANQWRPKDGGGAGLVPDAFGDGKREPRMLTTDLALRYDPIYEPISRRFKDDQAAFSDAYARAWYKLTHRDMGPAVRLLGPEVPSEVLIWQDPVPAVDHALVEADDVAGAQAGGPRLRPDRSAAGVHRVGVRLDVPRQRQARRRQRRAAPACSRRAAGRSTTRTSSRSCCARLRGSRTPSTASAADGKKVSLADLIVIAGNAAVEKAAADAGVTVTVPFTPGRTDATAEQTDVESFAHLEPKADGFRNYVSKGQRLPAEYLLVDKANLLTLSAPEMTVLVGGLRVLGANYDGSKLGVFTETPGVLTNDFFVNLLDYDTTWTPTSEDATTFEGRTADGEVKWTGSRVDLIFGSNSELRAVAEVYARRRREGAVRQRLRRGVGQGGERGPVRHLTGRVTA